MAGKAHKTSSETIHRVEGADEGRTRELPILNAIAEALNSSRDVPQALDRTLVLVAELLGLRTGWVWLQDPETRQFYVAAARNLPPYLQEPIRMSGRWCLCTDLFRRGELAPANVDVLECSRLREAFEARTPEAALGLRYHASIPLYFQERGLGIMNIAGPDWRRLTADELRLLSTIAFQVGIAVDRGRLATESARLARAAERARLAREIHDVVAQGLTAIGLDIEGALRHLDSNPERARERLERALTTTRESLEEARRSVLDLRSAPLAGRPLVDALGALARTFTSETGVRVHVGATGELNLPLHVEAELYWIAHEALANVRRHARAMEVEILLRATSREAVLAIRDNGVGFEPRREAVGHHGIIGMRERAKLLGGQLRVGSQPGKGTSITARIPLQREDRG
jgi:two-component system NarL family sensor kinase